MESIARKSKNLRRLILVLSIAIPVVVAALFGIKVKGVDLTFLPPIYASINALTAVLLVLALVFVKQKKFKLHSHLYFTVGVVPGLLCGVSPDFRKHAVWRNIRIHLLSLIDRTYLPECGGCTDGFVRIFVWNRKTI